VRRRYNTACDYVRGSELLYATYTRNMLMARAYELQKENDPSLVVESLQDHGSAHDKYATEASYIHIYIYIYIYMYIYIYI